MTTDNAFTARFFQEHRLAMTACLWLATIPYDRAYCEPQDGLVDALADVDLVERLFPRAADALRGLYEDEDEPWPGELVGKIASNGYLGFFVCIDSLIDPNEPCGIYHMFSGYGETMREAIHSALQSLDDVRAKKLDSYEPVAGLYMRRSHD